MDLQFAKQKFNLQPFFYGIFFLSLLWFHFGNDAFLSMWSLPFK